MQFFEHMAVDGTEIKQSLWLKYVDETFIIWKNGIEGLPIFLDYPSNARTAIRFYMEMESDGSLPVFNVLVTKKGVSLVTMVYRKPTHTGCYLYCESSHLFYLKTY